MLLDERSSKKVAFKAGLTSQGPAMQVRIMLQQQKVLEEWQSTVFDKVFAGRWVDTLEANIGEALRLGEQMWKEGKGESETQRTFEHQAMSSPSPVRSHIPLNIQPLSLSHELFNELLVAQLHTVVRQQLCPKQHVSLQHSLPRLISPLINSQGSKLALLMRIKRSRGTYTEPINNLFAGFHVSSLPAPNKDILSRMASAVSQGDSVVFEDIEFIKTDFQRKKDGTFIVVQSKTLNGLIANKAFDEGSHKQAFEKFRYNDFELVAKKHFRFDHRAWQLATMTENTNHQLLEMECKKAILIASYLKAFSEKLVETYDMLPVPTLIYTPCFLMTSPTKKSYMVEPDLRSIGKYIKINNTDEFIMPDEATIEKSDVHLYRFMHAFIHFVFHMSASSGKSIKAQEEAMVVLADIQGFRTKPSGQRKNGKRDYGEFHLFDVVTHTARGDSSMGDGGAGMLNLFINDHICGDACIQLGLKTAKGHPKSFPNPFRIISLRVFPWWLTQANDEQLLKERAQQKAAEERLALETEKETETETSNQGLEEPLDGNGDAT
ncbi:hypothetical protein M231_07915 [Tremella mesenterica]|uniref:Alpha-type protein kinase domain-containing protein n=1 Tax=Tremella mesenterica TaxID=5217 RepID=A0A4Q1B887_TREME|nr:hypothetical protein M231_07915 [Tremella mesenterica]